jgi:hypothetical protein
MTGLPLALQALVWTYVLVAGGAVLACLVAMWAGMATGRHRRRKSAAWRALGGALARFPRDVADGLASAAELIFYGRVA